MEIAPSVYWLDGRSSNFYLCEEDDGLTLVDTGIRRRENLVFDAIKRLGRRDSSLAHILITHADGDHAGSVARIHERTGATIFASPESGKLLRSGKSPDHLPKMVQRLFRRMRRYEAVSEEDITICNDGDVLPMLGGIQVLATPGHSPDHLAFYSPTKGILFAGDALTTRRNRLSLLPQVMTGNVEDARRSAIRLLGLAPAVIACGHGKPMSSHSSDDLMKLLNELRTG